MKVNKTLQILLDQQNLALKNNELCLSIYHNIDNPSKSIIKSAIRDLVLDYLKKFNYEHLAAREIAHQISEVVYNQEIYKRSIGIIARLGSDLTLNENLFLIFSDIKIEEYGYVGEIFDLTSAIKMNQADSNSLVIDISKEKILIFKSKDEDFEKIKEIENKILEAMEDRYTGMHSTGENAFVHQGSAMNEKKDKFATTILNNMFEELNKLNLGDQSFKRVLIFCSPDFSSHKDKIIDLLKKYSTNDPIVVQKTLKLESDIKEHAKKEIESIRSESKDHDLENLQTANSSAFADDWENVIKAAREARIYKLYIKEGFHEPGFLLNKDLPYIMEEENVESTKNLTPWIIKKTFETGGEIFVLDNESNEIQYPVLAALRF